MRVNLVVLACVAVCQLAAARSADTPSDRWRLHAANVVIVRDDWGIAHVHGKSDADTVFGAIYAQAEDDFMRIERNYLQALGWLAQSQGESAVFTDLRARMFVDAADLQRKFMLSPVWLQDLMTAWADGLNYYLSKHPGAQPHVIRRFEPWMALAFTEGSIGGDVESIDVGELRQFYEGGAEPAPAALHSRDSGPGGSNGFAIAPSRSASGHALLWINPHTSYYFRAELQMSSDAGLNVYGAATWGQFFIYQGFNSRNGWMHTSYGGDAVDEYAESMACKSDGLYYRYGTALKKMGLRRINVQYKTAAGLKSRGFTVFYTEHGPIVRSEAGSWIAVQLLQDPVRALMQSFLRTKTADYRSFYKIQEMRTDTSNNTVYADADGTIAYFHGNFVPRRDPRFDYTHPVDGSDPATDWRGAHPLSETITLLNPSNGWIQNTNDWPFSAAGAESPKREHYPAYMWTKGENPRGLHAVEVLQNLHAVTLDSLIAAGYDAHLTAFDLLLPPLFAAFDALPPGDRRRQDLQEPIASLRSWDHRTSQDSAATALAIFWGQELVDRKKAEALRAEQPIYDFLVSNLNAEDRLAALAAALDELRADFGGWRIPWGEINRYQRISDDIVQPFDDAKPSLPVGFAAAQWGALASFDGPHPRRTHKIYGNTGNSFVAAVEFGPTVHAKAIMSGGESGDPASAHFTDQALMFTQGKFRDVYFYMDDLRGHAQSTYHP